MRSEPSPLIRLLPWTSLRGFAESETTLRTTTMAKGLRASSRKKNNQALRARLYGPASDARAERLSAKLQELAAKPRPDQERVMDVDEQETKPESTSAASKDEG